MNNSFNHPTPTTSVGLSFRDMIHYLLDEYVCNVVQFYLHILIRIVLSTNALSEMLHLFLYIHLTNQYNHPHFVHNKPSENHATKTPFVSYLAVRVTRVQQPLDLPIVPHDVLIISYSLSFYTLSASTQTTNYLCSVSLLSISSSLSALHLA